MQEQLWHLECNVGTVGTSPCYGAVVLLQLCIPEVLLITFCKESMGCQAHLVAGHQVLSPVQCPHQQGDSIQCISMSILVMGKGESSTHKS